MQRPLQAPYLDSMQHSVKKRHAHVQPPWTCLVSSPSIMMNSSRQAPCVLPVLRHQSHTGPSELCHHSHTRQTACTLPRECLRLRINVNVSICGPALPLNIAIQQVTARQRVPCLCSSSLSLWRHACKESCGSLARVWCRHVSMSASHW